MKYHSRNSISSSTALDRNTNPGQSKQNDMSVPRHSTALYNEIREILLESRNKVYRVVNTTMVYTYFDIGRVIVEDEQKGEKRAEYGKEVLQSLSKRLTREFGRGFSRQNLQNMKQFYLVFQNCQTLSSKLSWSHYMLLMRIENEQARSFYTRRRPGMRTGP